MIPSIPINILPWETTTPILTSGSIPDTGNNMLWSDGDGITWSDGDQVAWSS